MVFVWASAVAGGQQDDDRHEDPATLVCSYSSPVPKFYHASSRKTFSMLLNRSARLAMACRRSVAGGANVHAVFTADEFHDPLGIDAGGLVKFDVDALRRPLDRQSRRAPGRECAAGHIPVDSGPAEAARRTGLRDPDTCCRVPPRSGSKRSACISAAVAPLRQ